MRPFNERTQLLFRDLRQTGQLKPCLEWTRSSLIDIPEQTAQPVPWRSNRPTTLPFPRPLDQFPMPQHLDLPPRENQVERCTIPSAAFPFGNQRLPQSDCESNA